MGFPWFSPQALLACWESTCLALGFAAALGSFGAKTSCKANPPAAEDWTPERETWRKVRGSGVASYILTSYESFESRKESAKPNLSWVDFSFQMLELFSLLTLTYLFLNLAKMPQMDQEDAQDFRAYNPPLE